MKDVFKQIHDQTALSAVQKIDFENLKTAILESENQELVVSGYRFTADHAANTVTITKIKQGV